MREVLSIGDKQYAKSGSPPVFRVQLKELDRVRFADVPYYSTLEIEGLPGTAETYQLEIRATHAGGPSDEQFFLYFHVGFWQPGDAADQRAIALCSHKLRHIKRTFQDFVDSDLLDDGEGEESRTPFRGRWLCRVLYSANFTREQNPMLAELVTPFLTCFQRLVSSPHLLLFLCHASEDKSFVDEMAAYLDRRRVPVWYDKREIKLGESIVQRISEGIESASHLLVVLSRASAAKPWVQKELSAALMRQLDSRSIAVIPILREACSIPPLLADLKYADCRGNAVEGFNELVRDICALDEEPCGSAPNPYEAPGCQGVKLSQRGRG